MFFHDVKQNVSLFYFSSLSDGIKPDRVKFASWKMAQTLLNFTLKTPVTKITIHGTTLESIGKLL